MPGYGGNASLIWTTFSWDLEMRGIKTREAFFGINDLIHKRRDQGRDIYACWRDTSLI